MPRRRNFSLNAKVDEVVDTDTLRKICDRSKTIKLACYYLFVLRKITKTYPAELPHKPHYICAFIASEHLQDGTVLARQAINARGDQATPEAFFGDTEEIQRLLCEAASGSVDFQYTRLPEWTRKCKYCTSKQLVCFKTSRLSRRGRRVPEGHVCQICVVHNAKCEGCAAGECVPQLSAVEKSPEVPSPPVEESVKSLPTPPSSAPSTPTVKRRAAKRIATFSAVIGPPVKIQRIEKTAKPASQDFVRGSSSATVAKKRVQDDHEDDRPIPISPKLRKRSLMGALSGTDKKRRISVDEPTSAQLSPSPVTSSSTKFWDMSMASSSSLPSTPPSQVRVEETEHQHVTLVCETVQEIVSYVQTHGCNDHALKMVIEDIAEAFQELRKDAMLLKFAVGRVITRLERVPHLDDNKLKILLRSLSRQLPLLTGLTAT